MRSDATAASPSSRLERVLRGVVIVGAVAFIVAFAATAIARLGIPAPLTDVRLGTLQHVQRVLNRQPLYDAPTSAFVPLDYPPIYYYASAITAALAGNGYAALRLTSLVSTLAAFVLAAAWARHETGSWWAGVLAAGLYAATYRMTDAWFDVERVDALCVALMMAAFYVLRRSASLTTAAASAALFLMSALTKQTTWVIVAAVAILLLVTDRRRGALFSATLVAGALLSTMALTLGEGRWYGFFVFGIGSHEYTVTDQFGRWLPITYDVTVREVVFVLPCSLLLLAAWGFSRSSRAFYATAWCATVGAALATQLVQESRVNALMPVYAVTAVVTAIAAWELMAQGNGSRDGTMRLVAPALCVAQFALLAYVPWHLVRPFPGPDRETVLVVSGTGSNLHVATQTLPWSDAWRLPHADLSAAADLLSFAPPDVGRQFADGLVHDLCLATDARPFVVNALLFDRDWQETATAQMGRPLPLPATIDAAIAGCRQAAVH